MSTFSQIQTDNSGAIPADTDLIVVEKADGNPAAYTLLELAAHVNGITFPQWQTDAAHGALLRINIASQPHDGGVVPFDKIVRDNGFYTASGILTIPSNVTKVQVVAQITSTVAGPTLMVVKNSDTASPEAKVDCVGTHSQIISPEFDVVAGDIIQIHCSDIGSILNGTSHLSIRTLEKTV